MDKPSAWEVAAVAAISSFITSLVCEAFFRRKPKPPKPIVCQRCTGWHEDTLEGPGYINCPDCQGTGLNLDNKEAVIRFIVLAREAERTKRHG